jgi:hypothetical protein
MNETPCEHKNLAKVQAVVLEDPSKPAVQGNMAYQGADWCIDCGALRYIETETWLFPVPSSSMDP